MSMIQSIRNGQKEEITLSEIAEDIISMPLARENMTDKEYEVMLKIYNAYKKNDKRYKLDYEGLIKVEAAMVGSIKKKIGNKEFSSFYDERACVNNIVNEPEKKEEIIEEYFLKQSGELYDPLQLTNRVMWGSGFLLMTITFIINIFVVALIYYIYDTHIEASTIGYIGIIIWIEIAKKAYKNIVSAKKIKTKKEAKKLWMKILLVEAIIINITGVLNVILCLLIFDDADKRMLLVLFVTIADFIIAYKIAGSKYIKEHFSSR